MNRYVYSNDLEGKRRAISNLQFALEDKNLWYMNTKFKPNETAIVKGKFANWITRDTFDQACKAIKYALEPISFYQFDDIEEYNPKKSLDFPKDPSILRGRG